jgi:hypothetical protein
MDLKAVVLQVVDWIHLAGNRGQRQVSVNIVMNLKYHKTWGFSQ